MAWTTFHLIANASLDLHADSVEVYAWSRHLAAGYYKHPPLDAFVAALWFALFPAADWSFYLLGTTNAALALFAVDLIARRYLRGDKRLIALLLLLLTPFYQFHSERFGANQVLLWTWPLATFCFLRAFETRNIAWSAAAGTAAALAMLGKYYSAYLIASFIVAAAVHPRRWRYLRSSSPWVSCGVGLALLAPHLRWLVANDFAPFVYAAGVHRAATPSDLTVNVAIYLISALAYVAVLVAVYLLAVRPGRQTLADALWPSAPDRRMLVVLLIAQLLLPPATAPFLGMQITALWTMSAWFLLPIVLLTPSAVDLSRTDANRVALGVGAMTIAALLVAPGVAWVRHLNGTKQGREYYRLLSTKITEEWWRFTPTPLSIVQGHEELIGAVAFYSPAHPDALPGLSVVSWINATELERKGWVQVCFSRDPDCQEQIRMQVLARPDTRRFEIDVARSFLGKLGKPERFLVALVAPSKTDSR
jgi:4-amino-4-deoxy-L-arabinose transferase-like glycosyltransferase